MINGASPITFQLKASLKHGSSAPHRRMAFDRLCTGYAIPITMSIYAALAVTHFSHKYLCVRCICVWKKSLCHQNKCGFITVRLRAVQRGNAHYYIDAGLTPPYTQQSIKSKGDGGRAVDQNHWDREEQGRRLRGRKKRDVRGD